MVEDISALKEGGLESPDKNLAYQNSSLKSSVRESGGPSGTTSKSLQGCFRVDGQTNQARRALGLRERRFESEGCSCCKCEEKNRSACAKHISNSDGHLSGCDGPTSNSGSGLRRELPSAIAVSPSQSQAQKTPTSDVQPHCSLFNLKEMERLFWPADNSLPEIQRRNAERSTSSPKNFPEAMPYATTTKRSPPSPAMKSKPSNAGSQLHGGAAGLQLRAWHDQTTAQGPHSNGWRKNTSEEATLPDWTENSDAFWEHLSQFIPVFRHQERDAPTVQAAVVANDPSLSESARMALEPRFSSNPHWFSPPSPDSKCRLVSASFQQSPVVQRDRQQSRFRAQTEDGGDPWDSMMLPLEPHLNTLTQRGLCRSGEHLPGLVMYRLEWDVGRISQMPLRHAPGEGIVSPQFATNTLIEDAFVSLVLMQRAEAPPPTSIASQPVNQSSSMHSQPSKVSNAPPQPCLRVFSLKSQAEELTDPTYGVKFTTTAEVLVRFSVEIGSTRHGPVDHNFVGAPWSPIINVGSLLEEIEADSVRIAILIHLVTPSPASCFPRRRAISSMTLATVPPSRQPRSRGGRRKNAAKLLEAATHAQKADTKMSQEKSAGSNGVGCNERQQQQQAIQPAHSITKDSQLAQSKDEIQPRIVREAPSCVYDQSEESMTSNSGLDFLSQFEPTAAALDSVDTAQTALCERLAAVLFAPLLQKCFTNDARAKAAVAPRLGGFDLMPPLSGKGLAEVAPATGSRLDGQTDHGALFKSLQAALPPCAPLRPSPIVEARTTNDTLKLWQQYDGLKADCRKEADRRRSASLTSQALELIVNLLRSTGRVPQSL